MEPVIPIFNEIADCFERQIPLLNLSKALNQLRKEAVPGKKPHYLSFSISIPKVDALAVLEQHGHTDEFQYYWEKPSDEFAIAAAGSLERVRSKGSKRFRESSTQGKELLSRVFHTSSIEHHLASVHLLGGFSFFEENKGIRWKDFGAGSFTLPEWTIVREGSFTVLTLTKQVKVNDEDEEVYETFLRKFDELEKICKADSYSIPPNNSSARKIKSGIPDTSSEEYRQWTDAIENATDLIKSDEFKKIVLARELRVKLDKPVSDTHILNNLRHQYPDCYSFLIRQNGTSSFIGSTPERLASFRNRFVFTEGLAGSISRGKTASEDAVLEHELLHSKKDLSEHSFVLDAIEENLERFSEVLEHPEKPEIKKLSNVQHLYTPVRAKIRDDVSRTEVLAKLHPTPAVGGYPRDKAIPFINKLEHFDRGWYAAPIGWINAHGEGEFAVAIRSGLIKEKEVCFFAGCGIVKDSDPQKEWEETNLKFIPMLTALEHARN